MTIPSLTYQPKEGYVYILSNPSMPNLLKIGMSTRGAKERANELFTTGVPTPFKLEFEIYAKDYNAAESYIHDDLDQYRVSDSREFFKVDLEIAVSNLLNLVASDYSLAVTPIDLYDAENDLMQLAKISSTGYSGFVDVLMVKSSLRFISREAIDLAFEKYRDYISSRGVKL